MGTQDQLAAQFEDRVKRIKRQLDAGVPKTRIAKDLDISRKRLYEILARAQERGLL